MGRPALILIPILAAGAVLRFWALDFGIPHVLAHPDESRVAKTAVDFLSGDLNPGFFNYPTLFMYVLGAAYAGLCATRAAVGQFDLIGACAASWPHAWEPFFLTARALSAAAGTISILLVYWLGRRIRAARRLPRRRPSGAEPARVRATELRGPGITCRNPR